METGAGLVSNVPLYPLRFRPIFKRAIWGGRRFETVLGKRLPPGDDWSESWEVCDHDADQSIVEFGPLAGATLEQLTAQRGEELLGRHDPQWRFPLLAKFLDGRQTLSLQVHPNDAQAARLTPPDLGKTEVWVVMQAEPGSVIYAGLEPGVDRARLDSAIRQGRCEPCLHTIEARRGDCVLVPAGTVHALGAGLLVAEIQQASDVTYRLFDWNRLGPDGKLRPLRIEQGLDVVDFGRGPVEAQKPRPTDRPWTTRLAQCDKFVLDRWTLDRPELIGGDRRCHLLTVFEGQVVVEGDPAVAALTQGGTLLLPASLGEVRLTPQPGAVVLDAYLP
ncbi:MAG: type I phosphomannose isomerase catalytic subunit [Thermoguttaceae bacterium]